MSQSSTDEQVRESGARAGGTLLRMLAEGRSYSGRERNCCFLNTGADPRSGGRFANVSAASGLDMIDDGRAIGLVDWDHDGDLDVWISNRNEPRLRMMRNDTPTGNHFVAVRLVGNGTTSNRDAVGSRVEVIVAPEADETSLHRLVQTLRAGEGFLGQSSKCLQFGLGKSAKIEKIVVRWPSGASEEFSATEVDRCYELVQGSGIATDVTTSNRNLKLSPATPEVLPPSNVARVRLQVLLPAPELEYLSFGGGRRVLRSDSRNSVLVNLWSRTCVPCLAELTEFTERADEIRDAGIKILALSADALADDGDPAASEEFLARMGFPFQSGMATASLFDEFQDLHDHLMPLNRPLPQPTSLLIDPQGRLAVIYKGPVSVDQLLEDISHSSGTPLQRFARSASLPGSTIQNDVITSAVLRQEASVRDLYAKKLERAGLAQAAAAEFEEVLKLKPDYPYAQHMIGRVLTDQGKFGEAKEHYERALQVLPEDVNLHTALANVFIRHNNLDLARRHCQEAVRLEPDSAEFHVNLGNVLLQQNNLDQAKSEYEQAVKLEPKHAKACQNLGIVFLRQNNLAKAKEYFELAIRSQPEYAEAHFNLGTVYAQEDNFDKAKHHFEEALRIREDFVQAQASLARLIQQFRGGN